MGERTVRCAVCPKIETVSSHFQYLSRLQKILTLLTITHRQQACHCPGPAARHRPARRSACGSGARVPAHRRAACGSPPGPRPAPCAEDSLSRATQDCSQSSGRDRDRPPRPDVRASGCDPSGSARIGAAACSSRFRSAVSMSSSCRRRVSSASRCCSTGAGSGRGVGAHALGEERQDGRIQAVGFGELPVAFAKSRTCRGFVTTSGSPAAASAATSARSSPPVASATMSVGVIFRRRATVAAIPSGSFGRRPPRTLGSAGHDELRFRHVHTHERVAHRRLLLV